MNEGWMARSRRVTLDLIDELREVAGRPLLSLYVPTIVAGPETRQNRIRFKNGLGALAETLDEQDRRRLDANWSALVEVEGDQDLWQHTGRGMAWFVGPDTFEQVSLPVEPEECTRVSSRFLLRPLFAALEANQSYQVLAVSLNQVRCFEGDGYGLRERNLPDSVPASLFDALGSSDEDASQQFHSPHGGATSSRDATILHDQHEGEHSRARVNRFLSRLGAALESARVLQDLPLVLAGPGFEMHMFQDHSEPLANRVVGTVDGNFDGASESELHARVWPVVADWVRARRRRAAEQLRETAPSTVATGLEDVVSAAATGRVETLFFVPDREVSGSVDRYTLQARRAAAEHRGTEDLVERALRETLGHGGRVYAVAQSELVQQDDDEPLAAKLRY